jgi:hypothetical protein
MRFGSGRNLFTSFSAIPKNAAFVQEEIEHVNFSDDCDTDRKEEENDDHERIGIGNDIELHGI